MRAAGSGGLLWWVVAWSVGCGWNTGGCNLAGLQWSCKVYMERMLALEPGEEQRGAVGGLICGSEVGHADGKYVG